MVSISLNLAIKWESYAGRYEVGKRVFGYNFLAVFEQRKQEIEDWLKTNPAAPIDSDADAISFNASNNYTRGSLEGELGQVEEAIRKWKEGSYGTCLKCGEAIPEERLQSLPWVQECVLCVPSKSGAKRWHC